VKIHSSFTDFSLIKNDTPSKNYKSIFILPHKRDIWVITAIKRNTENIMNFVTVQFSFLFLYVLITLAICSNNATHHTTHHSIKTGTKHATASISMGKVTFITLCEAEQNAERTPNKW
jgi:preprotein translocase subunit SecG